MWYKMVQPPLAVASVHFVFCLVYLASEGGAAVGDFCTDVSYWDVLKYQTTIKQYCETELKQRCTFKSDHVCKKVPEIQCEVVSWPLCQSTPTLTESKKCEVRYRDYSHVHCKDVKSSITHTKMVPECREITRENCVTDWKVDANGNKVWSGKETCTPVRWEECGIVERQVELPMMRTDCSAGSIIKWADIVDKTKQLTGFKTQCQVKSSVDCKKKTVTKCASVSWEECSMVPVEECQPVEVYTPSQEKVHRKNCFNPNAAEIKCYSEPTTSEETLGCASGYEAPLWDGCIDDGSYRVRCPKGYFPCNDLRNNGKEFKCGIDCSNKGGKRSDCIEENLPLCYSVPTTYEDKLECANGELAYLWDGCIDQDSYRIRCPKGYVPCIDIRKNGKEFMCGTDCSTKGGKRSDCLEDYLPKSGNWILLFRQTINGKDRFYKKNEWIRNEETVDAPNYSILGDFDKFRKPDGSFHLVLWYPELGTFNEWTQTSNPVTKTTRGVDNYKAIRTPYTGFYWGGLEHNNGEALLDGSVDNGYWWYAIGSFTDFRGGIPGPGIPGPGGIPDPKDDKGSHVVEKVELYIDPGCVEKFDYDTDYKGGDVSDGANVKSNNKEDCRNICRAKTGCNFWTFVKSWRNNCLLKYSSEGKEPHSGYVSGNICKGVDVLRLYEYEEEAGRSLTLYGPTDLQLRNFNNLASSVHAVKGDWELYFHSDYSGNRMVVKQGQKINTDRNEYSSARPICQYHDDQSTAKLKVYERVSSQGEEKEFLNEEGYLGNDWSDKISSVHVVKGDWELYEHKNYHGVREVVKEGDQIDIQHKNFHSSLRPICETYTYTPKCTPVRIEILGDPNSILKFKGSKIIGAASGFSCNDPSTKTLTLNSINSVTRSISLGASKSEGTDWSVGASATITGKVGFFGTGTEVSGTISGSTGGSTSVTHMETESFTTGNQTFLGSSTTYPTPGAAIAFGFVDIYETDNSDVQVKIHLDCDGKKKEELSTMKLTSHTFQSADFFELVKKIDNAEDCNKDGFINKIDECIRNVKARYINGFVEKEEMRKDFNDCFA